MDARMMVTAGALGAGCLTVAAGGVGYAVTSGHSGVIHACVAKSGGALRVVHNSKACTSREKPLSFDRRGPAGPRGRTGAAATSETFEMYANVDAEGQLGSNFDAESAESVQGSTGYVVTFAQPIGACAAQVQPGRAGGPEDPDFVDSTVVDSGPDSFNIEFADPESDGDALMHEPFMVTVTCPS